MNTMTTFIKTKIDVNHPASALDTNRQAGSFGKKKLRRHLSTSAVRSGDRYSNTDCGLRDE